MDARVIDAERLAGVEALLGRANRDTLLRLAIDHARAGAAAMEAAAAAGDGATTRREAHALRGAVAGIGADALVALLERIEREGTGLAALAPAVDALIAAAQAALGRA